MKICVYAISKNEEKFVERFCAAAADADLILIADTGSTDKTVALARKHGAKVHNILVRPWRFDHARNAALALVPGNIDVCVSLDLDEVLQPGWRKMIEDAWTPETTRLRYMFDWGCGIAFKYEKIHARWGYSWHHPCHEYPVPDKRITEVWADAGDQLMVIHQPDPEKSRGQYMELLELAVAEDPNCPRNAFYHARELSYKGRWQESIDALNAYLLRPDASWSNERCYALRTMARCYTALGNDWEAERALHRAAAEAPWTREPWFELTVMMYRQGRWAECYAYAQRILAITDRDHVYTVDPEVWGPWPEGFASIAAWNMGLKDAALDHAKTAAAKAPDDQRLAENLRFMLGDLGLVADLTNDIRVDVEGGSDDRSNEPTHL